MDLLAKPCVHNCGVMPESEYFIKGGAKIPTKQPRYCLQNIGLNRLNARQTENLDRDDNERIVAYTDGTACNPDDQRRRRAAWGVFYSHDHAWNCHGPIDDELQTVYRAELTAVNHVIQSANTPTHIVSDCLSVVNTMRDILAGLEREVKGDHADLWAQIQRTVRSQPPGYYSITWVPSHTDIDAAQETEDRGGHKRSMILGNQAADNEAKAGMSAHPIDWEEYRHADDKIFLATITQTLIKDVWERHFTSDMEAKCGPELTRGNLEENYDTADWGDLDAPMEHPPEVEEIPDPWAAEQEAADWLGNSDRMNAACAPRIPIAIQEPCPPGLPQQPNARADSSCTPNLPNRGGK